MRKFLPLLMLFLVLVSACNKELVIKDGFITNGPQSLYYKTMGSGDPIVVLHGGPGFDHRQFLPFIWELANDHQVILFDQRCTGLSTGPADSTTINVDTFIEDIEAVRKFFGIKKMNLMGHSFGGILAMKYSLKHEANLKSLTLCSTTATATCFPEMRDNYEADRDPGDSELLTEIWESEEYQSGSPAAVEKFWRVYFKPYFADHAQVEKLDLQFTENTISNGDIVGANLMKSLGEFELHEDLKKLSCPTLVIHGDADPMDPKYARQIHESIDGSELVIIEGAGHWLFVDGTEVFIDSILDFLEKL